MKKPETPLLGQILRTGAERFPDEPALRVADGDRWRTWTFADAARDADRVAARLLRCGVAEGDRVAIFAGNRPEWTLADAGILSVGAISVPIYFNSSAEAVAHVLTHSGATVVIVAGEHERSLLGDAQVRVISMDPLDGVDPYDADATEQERSEIARRSAAADYDDVATIVYTSGTTGQPRGAMLTHRNFTHQIDAINTLYDLHPGDQSLCFLPLAHALERVWTYCVLSNGVLNTYVTKPRDVADLLVRTRPNLFISVPKFYDRVYTTVFEKASGSKVKTAILRWALSVGGRAQRRYRKGAKPPLSVRWALPLADALVLKKVRDAIGGPKKVLISGGAPLRREVEEFFSSCGVLLGQGYGLTESAPMMTFFSPSTFKLGTVGYPIWGAEMKIGVDQELLYRGPNVMKGYWNDPVATAEVIDDEGWLHTGDVGYIDEQGYVTVTDRLKDIIVTNGGKNVAPQPIEALLLSDPLFEQVVVLGNDRPYLTALMQPSKEGLEELGRQLAVTWNSVEDLIENQTVVEEVRRRVAAMTDKLPHFEQIRDLTLLSDVINTDSGLLTPTLKVKRREVEKRLTAMIDAMYDRSKSGKPKRSNHGR